MKQGEKGLCFVLHLNPAVYLLLILVIFPGKKKSSLLQSPVSSDLTEMSSCFYLAGPPEALSHLQSLAQHRNPAGICAPGAVPGREGSGR